MHIYDVTFKLYSFTLTKDNQMKKGNSKHSKVLNIFHIYLLHKVHCLFSWSFHNRLRIHGVLELSHHWSLTWLTHLLTYIFCFFFPPRKSVTWIPQNIIWYYVYAIISKPPFNKILKQQSITYNQIQDMKPFYGLPWEYSYCITEIPDSFCHAR